MTYLGEEVSLWLNIEYAFIYVFKLVRPLEMSGQTLKIGLV